MQNHDTYYQAYKRKDAQYDGQFFIGVVSTGIYCRPVCTARMPQQKNCRFFETAMVAEAQGFRPCLRCRPDLPPGFAAVDIAAQLAHSAKTYIEQDMLSENTLEQLAQKLGITSRHLRRIFIDNFGMSPTQFAKHQQLTLARQLLAETELLIIDIALTVGFRSLRQFNYAFKHYFQTTPSHCRQQAALKKLS